MLYSAKTPKLIMSKDISDKNILMNEFNVLFNESTIPQGLIKADLLDDKSCCFYILQANKAFYKIAGIEPLLKPEDVESIFKFLDGFNSQPIKQFYLTEKSIEAHFIFSSGAKAYKLNLNKIANGNILFSFQDITNLQNIRAELNEKKRQLKESQEIAKLGYWIENHKTKKHFWTDQIFKIINETSAAIKPSFSNYLKYVHNDDRKSVELAFNDAIQNKTGYDIIHRLKLKNKSTKHIVQRCYTNYDNKGKPVQSVGIIQDVTTSEIIKKELQNSEAVFRSVFDYSPMAIVLVNKNFNPLFCNNQFSEIIGYSMLKVLQLGLKDFTHPNDYENNLLQYKQLFKGEIDSFLVTKRYIRKDGTVIWTKVTVSPVKNPKGEVDMAIAMVQDISAEKKAQQQSEEYKLFLETLMNNLPVSLFAKTTPDFRFLYWNHSIEKATGISTEDAIGKTDFEIQQSKKLAEQYHSEDKKLLKQEKKLESEHEFANAMGELRQFKTIKTLHKPNVGNPLILGISIDITKLKEAEKQVDQSTHMLKEAQKIAKLGYWEYDVQKDMFFDNLENRQILGTDNLPYFINAAQFTELLHKDDRGKVAQTYKRCLKEKTVGEDVVRIVSNTETKNVSINYKPIVNSIGRIEKLRGTCLDITELIKKEITLKRTTEQLIEIQNIAKIGFIEFNKKTNKFSISDTLIEILELKDATQIQFIDDFNAFIHTDDKKTITKTIDKSIQQNQSYKIQYRLKLKSGKIKFVNEICSINKTGKSNIITRILQDITPLKEHEIALNKISEVQSSTLLGTWEYNLNSKKYYLNEGLKKLFKLPGKAHNIEPKQFMDFIHVDDRHSVEQIIKKALKTQESFTLTYRFALDNNDIRYVKGFSNFYTTPSGDKIMYGMIRDITEYRNTLNELQDSAELFKAIAENSMVGIVIYQNGKRIYTNEKWAGLVGIKAASLNTNVSIKDIFKPESAQLINEIFNNWHEFKFTEYSNKVVLHPINAGIFTTELYIKEVHYNGKSAFLLLAYPTTQPLL